MHPKSVEECFQKDSIQPSAWPESLPKENTTVYVVNLPKGVANDELQEMFRIGTDGLKSYVRHDPAEANTCIMLMYLNENYATKAIETFPAAGNVFPGLIFDRGQIVIQSDNNQVPTLKEVNPPEKITIAEIRVFTVVILKSLVFNV